MPLQWKRIRVTRPLRSLWYVQLAMKWSIRGARPLVQSSYGWVATTTTTSKRTARREARSKERELAIHVPLLPHRVGVGLFLAQFMSYELIWTTNFFPTKTIGILLIFADQRRPFQKLYCYIAIANVLAWSRSKSGNICIQCWPSRFVSRDSVYLGGISTISTFFKHSLLRLYPARDQFFAQ